MEQQELSKYGYEPDAQITMSGKLFMEIAMSLEEMGQAEGTKIGFKQFPNTEQQLSPENKPEYYLSPIGMLTLGLLTKIDALHKEHIEKGIAKPVEELEENKPKISLAE